MTDPLYTHMMNLALASGHRWEDHNEALRRAYDAAVIHYWLSRRKRQ